MDLGLVNRGMFASGTEMGKLVSGRSTKMVTNKSTFVPISGPVGALFLTCIWL